MAVLALAIFPGLVAGQEPVLWAEGSGDPRRGLTGRCRHRRRIRGFIRQWVDGGIVGRIRVVLTEEETSPARIVTVEGPLFVAGTTVYLDRKMR